MTPATGYAKIKTQGRPDPESDVLDQVTKPEHGDKLWQSEELLMFTTISAVVSPGFAAHGSAAIL